MAAIFFGKILPFPNQKSRLNFFGTEGLDFGVWFLNPIACAALAATILGKFLPFPNQKYNLRSSGQCYFGTEVWYFRVWFIFL